VAHSSSSHRIEEVIQDRITSGEYVPGMKLPAERDLTIELGVSRMTLRQAVESLQFQGVLQRRPGRAGGTFVSLGVPVFELATMTGLAQQLSGMGAEVESTILEAGTVEASSEVSMALGLGSGELAHHLRRLRSADEKPVMIEDAWYPAAALPGFPVHSLTGSAYSTLREYGSAPVRKVEELFPSVATLVERDLLGVGARHPVLRLFRTAYRADGIAVEYSHDVYRSDAMRVRVTTVNDALV